MNPRPRMPIVFAGSCLLTATGWALFWPDGEVPPDPSATPAPPVSSWDKPRIESAVEAVQLAGSHGDQLSAALRLGEIPVEEIQATLESIEIAKDHRLTLAAETLLIRWAGSDGKAAMEWAWKRFRGESLWPRAFRQMGPAWAWQDPAGFGNWVIASIGNEQRDVSDTTLDEALTTDIPILEFGDLNQVCGWLLQEDPRLAFQIFQMRRGISTTDGNLVKSLNDPRKIEEALLAFDDLEPLKRFIETGRISMGPEMTAMQLLKRWRDLDPEGFAASRYVPYLPPEPDSAAKSATVGWSAAAPEDRFETADRLLSNSPKSARYLTAGNLAKEWCAVDPEGCRAWIESLPDEAVGPAIGHYIDSLATENLDETLTWTARFKPELRTAFLVRAFDAWTNAHPGETPAMTDWSESRRGAWNELQALKLATTP